MVSEKQHM